MQLRLDLEGDNAHGLRRDHTVDSVAVIGRSSDSDWQLDCGERLVSRRHAFISREEESFVVYDASANGVYVNDATEPLGEGQRASLNHGDRLHIGPFSIAVTILDTAGQDPAPNAPAGPSSDDDTPALASPPPPSNAGPPLAPVRESAGDKGATMTNVTASRGLDLGETRDAFQPPSVTIPDDWDLEVDEDGGGEEADAGMAELGRHLESLEPSVMEGLLEGLSNDEAGIYERRLTRQQAYALGASLREGISAVLTLRAELDLIERELPSSPTATAKADAVSEDTDESIRRLISADDKQALDELARIRSVATGLPGRPTRITAALNQAASAVVRVFEPARFEERAARAARSPEGRAQQLRSLGARIMLKLAPDGQYWRSFRGWYAERGASSEGIVQDLFEKSLKRFILGERKKGNRQVSSVDRDS